MRASFSLEGRAKSLVVGLAVLLLAALVPLAGVAQERGIKRKPEAQETSAMGIGELYAVVVGVSKYEHPNIPQLHFSDKDAKDFAEFLKTQKQLFRNVHLTVLTNEQATKPEVEKHLWYKLRKAGKDDTVVLFFSGHGAEDPNLPGEFFFLTYQADPDFLQATAINMSGLRFLNKLDSKRVVLIADTCHAGGFTTGGTRSIRRSMSNFMSRFAESEGRVIMSSARSDQVSVEKPEIGNGVFTHFLLKGLRGEADLDKDGVVSLREAYEFVYTNTKNETNGIQHPQWEGRVVGTFPMSLVRLHPSSPVTSDAVQPAPLSPHRPTLQEPSELEKLRDRAMAGDVQAQFKLGLMLEYGINTAANKDEAIKWYQRAADKGNEDAKNAIDRLRPAPIQPVATHRPGERTRSGYLKEVQDYMGYRP